MTFKTMLAAKADPSRVKFPVMASPKLDGVRVHIIDGVAVSRNLLPFKNPNLQELFGRSEYNGLDGEFMVGDITDESAFRMTGVLNSHHGDVSNVRFCVFDDFTDPSLAFSQRFLNAGLRTLNNPLFLRVEHYNAENWEDIESLEGTFLDQGYEGLMIRDPTGRYKYGRSTTNEGLLLKLKRFEDGEAEIVEAEERMHNANEKTLVRNGKAVRSSHKAGKVGTNMLGAVTVRDLKTGVEFSIGSGFNDHERITLWQDPTSLLRRIVKYQYFPTGSKDKPRFPTFKGFRDRGDL